MTLRNLLNTELRAALSARDREAVAALRGALAALDNAGAVTVAEQASTMPSAPGAGATEVPRRELTEDDAREVVRADAAEHRAGAAALRPHARQRAEAIDRQAELLERLLRR